MKEELEKYDSVRWAEAFVLNPVGTKELMQDSNSEHEDQS